MLGDKPLLGSKLLYVLHGFLAQVVLCNYIRVSLKLSIKDGLLQAFSVKLCLYLLEVEGGSFL